MKIPFNQINFETIDWKCFQDCTKGNEELLQKLIDALCALNVDNIEFGCLNLSDKSIKGLLKLLVEKEKARCETTASSNSTSNNVTLDTSKIMQCGIDGWTYNTISNCINILSHCGNPIKIEDILNAIIARANSQNIVIKELNTRLIEVDKKFNELKMIVNQLQIKNNCCQ